MAKKALDELLAEKKDHSFTIEQVDIIRNPLRSLKDGVKMIPTLQCNNEKISGVILSKNKIAEFLNRVDLH